MRMGGTRRGQRWCKVGASSCAAKKGDGESDERGANAGTSGGTNKQMLGRSRVLISRPIDASKLCASM